MYMYAFAYIRSMEFMDRTLSVTSARQQLLKLTKDVRRRMDRVVLTNKGEAAAILMSVGEYKSLMAAAELAMRPDILKATREGFERIQRGEGISLDEAFPPAANRSAQPSPPARVAHRKRPAHGSSRRAGPQDHQQAGD
jgi:prevent-host-death family protein